MIARLVKALVAAALLGTVSFFVVGGSSSAERHQWLRGTISPLWIGIAVAFTGWAFWVLIAPGRAPSRWIAARDGLFAGFLAAATLAGAILWPFLVVLLFWPWYLADPPRWFWDLAAGGLGLVCTVSFVGALWGAGTHRNGGTQNLRRLRNGHEALR